MSVGSCWLSQNLFHALPVTDAIEFGSLFGRNPASSSGGAAPTYIEGLPTNGPISEDVQCTIEDLELANDSQLHTILAELVQTDFFSTFVVDLERTCPLSTWRTGSAAHGKTSEKDDNKSEGNDDDEFECSGGSDELDEDAEPLCSVQIDDDNDPFFTAGGGNDEGGPSPNFLESTVLQSLQSSGFESPEEQKTFQWTKQTDIVVVPSDDDPNAPCNSESSTEDSHLDDTFWMDMCSKILHDGTGAQLVDLRSNPERNTGYNGTHIWKAIYEENCIVDDDMCLEERVLYRLLSGLHTSTTLSIAKNYYPPSKRKNRVTWEANPQFFMDKFEHHPEQIRNLHFSYVVLLRALRKASQYLYDYSEHNIRSGNIVEDETAQILLRRLLDSAILQSCSSVFSAFDESLMFSGKNEDAAGEVISLQQNFKGVFHNISSILDCVQCQQCKLHGKMAMLGYGTALKILFLPPGLLDLERNEVVALINTIARLSESMREVRELTAMYWEQEKERVANIGGGDVEYDGSGSMPSRFVMPTGLMDITVGLVADLARSNLISPQREEELISLALARQEELLVLAKHYHRDPGRFLTLASGITKNGAGAMALHSAESSESAFPDAIVVGSGLAGLAASLNILDRGGTVVIVEKEHTLGGNSNKASSGINACCPHNDTYNDDLETFRNDTIRSAGAAADLELIETLVSNSEKAVTWLQERAGVNLSLLAQLGGHSHKRTHRPSNGMAGAEIIFHMQKAVKKFQKSGQVKIMVDTKVERLLTQAEGQGNDGSPERVIGVECKTADGGKIQLIADNVILATGGFAADRSSGSYLEQYRPELLAMPATAGGFSTGDGVRLATTLGAGTRDMNKVQVHPTGWVDPADPSNLSKTLAAELMRGVGGILLNSQGKRFCNELGTRAYVTDQMLSQHPKYAETKEWDIKYDIPTFSLVLSSSAAEDGKKHVELYTHKGLMTRLEGIDALSNWMGVSKSVVMSTLKSYQKSAQAGIDEFGKQSFRGVPAEDLSKEIFYAGTVTPVLHYCMGGIKIDKEGSVLREDGVVIPGLHAAGEVTGGVHGNNRLGGNSLLECTVYGTIVGQKIPIKNKMAVTLAPRQDSSSSGRAGGGELPIITQTELAKHNKDGDLWVAVHGFVYDFTEFSEEHPAGPQSIRVLGGTDGTAAFAAVHNTNMLEEFEEDKLGIFLED